MQITIRLTYHPEVVRSQFDKTEEHVVAELIEVRDNEYRKKGVWDNAQVPEGFTATPVAERTEDGAERTLRNAIAEALECHPYDVDVIRKELVGFPKAHVENAVNAAHEQANREEKTRQEEEREMVEQVRVDGMLAHVYKDYPSLDGKVHHYDRFDKRLRVDGVSVWRDGYGGPRRRDKVISDRSFKRVGKKQDFNWKAVEKAIRGRLDYDLNQQNARFEEARKKKALEAEQRALGAKSLAVLHDGKRSLRLTFPNKEEAQKALRALELHGVKYEAK